MDQFSSQWMQQWQSCVNKDGVMKNVGRYFDENVLLDFGEDKAYVVQFRSGRVERIVDKAGPEDRYAFALRAPTASSCRWKNRRVRNGAGPASPAAWSRSSTASGASIRAFQSWRK